MADMKVDEGLSRLNEVMGQFGFPQGPWIVRCRPENCGSSTASVTRILRAM